MSRPALRPLYLPTVLAVFVAIVVTLKLCGVAYALATSSPPESEKGLYGAFYDFAPAYAWGLFVGLPGLAVAVAFARQCHRIERTRALWCAALLAAAVFVVVGYMFTYQNGGFSTGTAMYGGGCILAAGLATEGCRPRLPRRRRR